MKIFFSFLFVLFIPFCKAQPPSSLTPAEKVYGLSKFWQEVNYNFVYLDRIDRAHWDSTYLKLIEVVQNTKNDYEYYRELERFCALLKDGHTNVFMPESITGNVMTTRFGDYRLFVENIEGRAIVVRTNYSKKDEIPIGSEIIEVNGRPTQEYIDQEVAPYISSSTDYVLQDWCIGQLLQGLVGSKYQVKIRKPDDEIIVLQLTHKEIAEEEVYPPFEEGKDLLEFKWLENKMAYVSLNSFGDERIDDHFQKILPELYQAKSLIIDLRNNGGGSTDIGLKIFRYLTTDKLLYGARSSSRIHIPAYKAWGKYVIPADTIGDEWNTKVFRAYNDKSYFPLEYYPEEIKLKAKRIVVPTAILIDHNTASAAEDFLIYADNQKHIVTIGENTFGSTGQPLSIELPGGGTARICTKKDTYPDGREFVGFGIKPDIEVKYTVDDFLSKRDPVLDRSVIFLNEAVNGKN